MPLKVDNRHAEIGGNHRAMSRYYMIKYRLKNTHLPKNKNYIGIELKVSKEDFINWFTKLDFKGCSVDRIKSTGHYELSNMCVIKLVDNIRKDKLKSINGLCVCYRCNSNKPLTEFSKDKRRINGYSTCCKECDNKRRKNVL